MNSNDLECERDITIYSINCSVMYQDTKNDIVYTPGHADFSSEVKRIINTVDTAILLVVATDGHMPQTRVFLQKDLRRVLKSLFMINQIDKKDARLTEVVNQTFDLFFELGATYYQLDFYALYSMAKQGKAGLDPNQEMDDLTHLFDFIISLIGNYPDTGNELLLLQVTSLAYDD